MGLHPWRSRKHTHGIGMVGYREDECGGGTRGLLGCAPLHSGWWLSHASHVGTLVPPDPGQFAASSAQWRKAEINLEGKLFCLSEQIEGNCLIDCVALISFYELPGAQSSLSDPPSELAGVQQDLC